MEEELEALEKNKTWEIIQLPKNKNWLGINEFIKSSTIVIEP
jgi:hypothetical protein